MKLFGSSGIRGSFNDLITPEFVCKVGQVVGSLYDEIVVGWDARTTSPLLSNALVSGMMAAGANAYIAGMVTTPTLARAVRDYKAGVMITASHNPPPDNGLKFWNPDGSSFGSEQMEEMENLLLNDESRTKPWDAVGATLNIDWPIERHISSVIEQIGRLDSKVVVDCGNGVTSGITPYVLRRLGCEVITLNANPDGSFPGRSSEPTEENTRILAKCVVESGADIGIAHDGDGDRMVAVDETGRFADGDALMPLFSKLEGKSKIVVPVNASMAVDRYLDGVEVIRCKVGDVFVAEMIKEVNADFGGEPSGTWVFPKSTLCPDAVFAAARLIQIIQEKPLSEYLAEIPRFSVIRKRVSMDRSKTDKIMVGVKEGLERLGPQEISELDGVRTVFEKGWILLRPSGTEPKLKIVIEGDTDEDAQSLLDLAEGVVKEVLG